MRRKERRKERDRDIHRGWAGVGTEGKGRERKEDTNYKVENKCLQKYGEFGTVVCCWGKCKSHCKKIMAISHKIKNRITVRSSNFTSGYIPKRFRNRDVNIYFFNNVYSNISYNSQNMEAIQMSMDR
jgi:hypothetical protein